MSSRQWTRPELLRVLSLYWQIPFGQMHRLNSAVIQLSGEINRSPSAIALKLANFASLDPELRQRGIGGMPNSSRADRAIWDEFYGQWSQLADVFLPNLVSDVFPTEESPRFGQDGSSPVLTEVSRVGTARRGQRFFRNMVLAAYDWRCCITDVSCPELLRASHISPWASDVEHRLNPRNGLCLNALHDAAFDRGLIAIGESNELLVATRLREEVPSTLYESAFEQYAGTSIRLPDRFRPDASLLSLHRETIYVG